MKVFGGGVRWTDAIFAQKWERMTAGIVIWAIRVLDARTTMKRMIFVNLTEDAVRRRKVQIVIDIPEKYKTLLDDGKADGSIKSEELKDSFYDKL